MYAGFEFCESYNVDVEKLTELWLTFCVNNNSEIDPTIDTLYEMENAVLKNDYKLNNLSTENNVNQEQSTMDEHFIENIASYPLIFHKIIII